MASALTKLTAHLVEISQLVVVLDRAGLVVALEEHLQALFVAARALVGIAKAVNDGENRAVSKDDAAIGPQIALAPVGETAFHAADGHR